MSAEGPQGRGAPLVLERSLPCDEDAPGMARGLVGRLLAEAGTEDRDGDVILAVSELVSNAVLHGPPGELSLHVEVAGERVRVEVRDQGTEPFGWPEVAGAGGHWGLGLVRQMSERAGVDRLPQTCAWCEI